MPAGDGDSDSGGRGGGGGDTGGGVGGRSCFVAGTLVHLSNGSAIRIEDVQIGDVLLGMDGSHNAVLDFDHPKLGDRKLYSFNGNTPFVTVEHPFLTPEGWKSLQPSATRDEWPEYEGGVLREGDLVMRVWPIKGDGKHLRNQDPHGYLLSAIEEHEADPETQLYNFVLGGNKTYIADGFLVHNKGGDDDGSNVSGSGSGGLTRGQIEALIQEQFNSQYGQRYDEWTNMLKEMEQQALEIAEQDRVFREQIWEQQLSKEQALYDLATEAGNQQLEQQGILFDQAQQQYQDYLQNFQPQETAMAANAMGLQYLSPEQQASMLAAIQDPNLTQPQRQQVLNEYQQLAQATARGEITANADTIENELAARAQEIEQYFGKEAADLYAREAKRAMEAEAKGLTQNQAALNSVYGQQQREMARRGFNPAQIAAAASQNANQQALASVAGNNQIYGLTADRLRQADDMATALRQQGALQGMDYRFAGQDTARTMRMGANQAVRDQFSGMQTNAAAFGRALPNYGLGASQAGTQAGTAGVSNQAVGFNAALPYAQFATGGTPYGLQAAGLASNNNLGIMNIISEDWRTKYRTDNQKVPDSGGGGSSAMLGAIAGGAMAAFSDPALKENEVPVGKWNDFTIYEFNYVGEKQRRLGFMATEVAEKVPAAVERVAGYLRVNYKTIGEAYGVL